MSAATTAFQPKFMRVGVLTAALQELTPREVRDADPDRAIEDWLQFALEIGASYIQVSAALHPSQADVPPEATVTAYQSASGWVNLITPTSAVIMGGLTLAKVCYDRFIRFVVPYLVVLLVLVTIFVGIAASL